MQDQVIASAAGGQRADVELINEMRAKEQRKKDKRTKLQPAPQELNNDWETHALAGIKSKNLHLGHEWSEKTWGNKATIAERLKLMKDAGVDITQLQAIKAHRSTAITKALRAFIEVRKQQLESIQAPVLDVSFGLLAAEDSQDEPFDPLFDELPSLSTNKRKRDDSPVEQSSETSGNANEVVEEGPPSYKKLCMASLCTASKNKMTRAEEEVNVWSELKDMVLTQIFDVHRVALELEPERANAPASHVTIKFPSLDDTAAASPLQLGELGYNSIMDELHVLSDSTDEHGTMHILEPAAVDGTAAAANRNIIKVITNIRHQTVFEGNLVALMGLLTRLSKKQTALLHTDKLCFDKAGIRKACGRPWELSDKTQQQLEDIKDALETGWEEGRMEVTVCWKGKEVYKKKEDDY